jgi:uncharacterized protein (DUF4415 family)
VITEDASMATMSIQQGRYRLFQQEGQIDMNSKDSSSTSRTNWAELEAMADEEIDYSDISPFTDEFFEKATLRIPATQAHRLVQIDPDVLSWFHAHGGEASINSVLRRYIQTKDEQSAME